MFIAAGSVSLLLAGVTSAEAQRSNALKVLRSFPSDIASGAIAGIIVETYKGSPTPTPTPTPTPAPPLSPNSAGQPSRADSYWFVLTFSATNDPTNAQSHRGTLRMQGGNGHLRVEVQSGGRTVKTVNQLVRAIRVDGHPTGLIRLECSSPTLDSGQLDYTYRPDTFSLIQTEPGVWTIADMCDVAGCAKVFVVDAGFGF